MFFIDVMLSWKINIVNSIFPTPKGNSQKVELVLAEREGVRHSVYKTLLNRFGLFHSNLQIFPTFLVSRLKGALARFQIAKLRERRMFGHDAMDLTKTIFASAIKEYTTNVSFPKYPRENRLYLFLIALQKLYSREVTISKFRTQANGQRIVVNSPIRKFSYLPMFFDNVSLPSRLFRL